MAWRTLLPRLLVAGLILGVAASILPALLAFGAGAGVQMPSDRLGDIQALDPAQRGYRHPLATGFVGPHDPVLSSAVPDLAGLRHDSYAVVIYRDRSEAATAWVQLAVPPEVMAVPEALTRMVACNLVLLISLQPHLAAFQRFRVWLVAGSAVPRDYELERSACGA